MHHGKSAAQNHIETLEARIEEQIKVIEQLEQAGKDTSEPTKRLSLLRGALAEIRFHLGMLSSTKADAKRPTGNRKHESAASIRLIDL